MSSLIIETIWTKAGSDFSKPSEGITPEEWTQWIPDYSICSDCNSGALKPGDPCKVQINYVPSKIQLELEKAIVTKGNFRWIKTLSDEETPKVKPVEEIV